MGIINRAPIGYYNDIDNIFKVYEKAQTRTELYKKKQYVVGKARKLGLHEMLISTIPERVRQPVVGNEARVREVAKLFTEVSEFKEKEPGAYQAASRLKILPEITAHMARKGNLYNRFVYQVFNNEYYYAGISVNPKRRFLSHKNHSCPKRRALFSDPNHIVLISKLMKTDDARGTEIQLVRKHRKEAKMEVLNRRRGGELGSPCRSESVEDLMEKAWGLTPLNFKKLHSGSYKTFCALPQSKKILIQLVMPREQQLSMTDKEVEEFCRGKSISEISKSYPSIKRRLYKLPNKNKILATMTKKIIRWDLESLCDVSRNKSPREIEETFPGAIAAIRKHPQKENIYALMNIKRRSKYSTEELLSLCRGKASSELAGGVKSALYNLPVNEKKNILKVMKPRISRLELAKQ